MTRVDGRYELLERLGEGTFGEVWKAQDTRFGARLVAVKFIKGEVLRHPNRTVVSQVLARFEAEAEALARVAHANVVAVIDRGEWEGAQYIVMEHVEGDSLADLIDAQLATGQPTDPGTVLGLFDQVCAGVEAAHDVTDPGPIVHRDLKPENVMVRRDARGRLVAKVLDFGIARLGAGGMTMAGPLGTLNYMPPEQGLGDVAEMGPGSDVFALGVMLVELLTGHAQPDPELVWWQFVLKRQGEVRGWLAAVRPDISPAVWDVVACALRRDVGQRYPNAFALREALAHAAQAQAALPPTETPPGTAVPPEPAVAPAPRPVTEALGGPAPPAPRPEANTVLAEVASARQMGWHGQALPAGLGCGDRDGEYLWAGDPDLDLGTAMVWVPPGTAVIGADGADGAAAPQHERAFGLGFWLGTYPVTVGEYERFVAATGYVTTGEVARDRQTLLRPGFSQDPRHPVVWVSWHDATAYCAWAGLRLATEFEWEYAARGRAGWPYPWGEEAPTDDLLWWSAKTARTGTCPVGRSPKGASAVGALDLAGNVMEWTSSPYLPYGASSGTPDEAPAGVVDDGTPRVIRGGCWCHDAAAWVRSAHRTRGDAAERYEFVGFRCALGPRT